MTALIDTQILIWYGMGNAKLPKSSRVFIEKDTNELILSVATAWEIIIKYSKGKLDLGGRTAVEFVDQYAHILNMRVLPISLAQTRLIALLPSIHSDPFDRILVAQAQSEGIPLLTVDLEIRKYRVNVFS